MIQRTCVKCGSGFTPDRASGRPRMKCFTCSPSQAGRSKYVAKGRARVCEVCGVAFDGLALAKYCSRQCKWKATPRHPCSQCGAPTGWKASRLDVDPSKVRCNPCTRAPHGSVKKYAKYGCRCEPCCEAGRRDQREYAARRRAEGRPVKQPAAPVNCTDCGVKLITGPRRAGDTYPTCVSCGQRRRNAIRSARRRRARLERLVADQARGTSGSWPWIQGSCAQCGEAFTRKGMASPYCSKKCRQRDRRGWITATRRRAIYARDGWTCQLCMSPIEPDLHFLDDWAATIDHITPRSLGGTHEDSNLRAAHRWCNSVRGAAVNDDLFEEAS